MVRCRGERPICDPPPAWGSYAVGRAQRSSQTQHFQLRTRLTARIALGAMKMGVRVPFRYQRVGMPLFYDLTVIEDDDMIRIVSGVKVMCDQ